MTDQYVLGDGKRKGRYDPTLADRVNANTPQETVRTDVTDLAEGLFVATYDKDFKGQIWVLKRRGHLLNAFRVAERDEKIPALAWHNDTLYEASGKDLRVTFNYPERRCDGLGFPEVITALCSHDGELYIANQTDKRGRAVIYRHDIDKKAVEVALRTGPVFVGGMCNYKVNLIDATFDLNYTEMISGYCFRSVGSQVYSLASHNGKLYLSTAVSDVKGDLRSIVAEFEDGLTIVRERQTLPVLCSHNDVLLDSAGGVIRNTLTDDRVFDLGSECITAMASGKVSDECMKVIESRSKFVYEKK